MATLEQLVDEVLMGLAGYGAPSPRATFLDGAVDETTLTLTVDSNADFNQGLIEVEGELMYVEEVDADGVTLHLSPDGRGFYGSAAAAHADNVRVTMNPTWPRTRISSAVNEAIEQTYPTLYGVASAVFTFNGSATTYELPEDCVQVLEVSADTLGPSQDQQFLRRYTVNLSAPTTQFPTGNTITLGEPVVPGRAVTVTYKKAPSALAAGEEFTTSGLRPTAWKAVRLSAMSELLNYLDAMRLPVDTAASAEFAERNQIGSAARISTQLWQRAQIELEQERRRLAAETPVPVNVRSR